MYLGVDLGTSSLKVLLCDNKGQIVDTARQEYGVNYIKAGYCEQNPSDWYDALVATIKTIAQKNDITKLKAISFCGHMHGLVVMDKDDNIIRPTILWNDSRSAKETEQLNDHFGSDKLLEMVGNIAFAGFTAPKLMWLKVNEPNNFAKIAKICLPKDYLLYTISGVFASDVTDNSGTLYFDVQNKQWAKHILDYIGVQESQLPAVYESSAVIGNVSKTFAALTGLSTSTKVVAGGGDQAVGAVGTGTVGNDKLSISLGTSGVVFASSDKYRKAACTGLHNFCHSDGKYHIMGCMLSCAASVDFWLNNIFGTFDYAAEYLAASTSKDDELLFLPYLAGERSPINDANAKGVLYGLTLNHTRADIVKAVVEGVCFGLKDCLQEINKLGINAPFATVIGGITKSQWWTSMLANVLGINICTLEHSEGGAFGAVILAMVGDGLHTSVQEACSKLVKINKQIFDYDKERAEYYNAKFARFKTLYAKLK